METQSPAPITAPRTIEVMAACDIPVTAERPTVPRNGRRRPGPDPGTLPHRFRDFAR